MRINLQHKFTGILTIVSMLAMVMGFVSQSAQAASPPNILTYQGRILDANGVPVSSSSVSMKFFLYSALSGGTCVWSNSSSTCDGNTPGSTTARTVTLTSGLFTENLGDTTIASPYAAIADSTFADNTGIYLEVQIAGETLSPRKQLVSAPYAQNADTLDGIDLSVIQLWEVGTNGSYEDDAAAIVGADAAFSYASGGVGDLRITDEIEVMGDGFIDNDLVVGASTSSTETITNVAFSLSGNDLFVASDAGIEGNLYIDGAIDLVGTATVGDLSCTDCLDFAELSDTLALDASTSVTQDGAEFFTITNSGTGDTVVNLSSTGDFIIQDNGTPALTVNDSGNTSVAGTLGVTGVTTLTDDLAVNGDDITSDGNLTLSATGYTRVGDTGTPGDATADDALYVEGAFEVDGTAYFGGTVNVSDLACTDCLDFAELSDTLALDASTSVTQDGAESFTITNSGTGDTVVNLSSTGDFIIQDNGTPVLTVNDSGNTTLAGDLAVNGGDLTSTATTWNIDVGNTGSFVFRDGTNTLFSVADAGTTGNATITGTLGVTGAVTLTNDLAVNGDDITSDGNLTLSATGYTRVGDTGTPGDATADDALYVEGAFEVDGTAYFGGTVNVSDLACTDCLDFTELADSMALDTNTTITQDGTEIFTISNTGTGATAIDLTSTGDLDIRDSSTPFFTFNDDRSIDYSTNQTTTDPFDFTADSVTTANALDFSVDALTTGRGIYLTTTSGAATSADLLNTSMTGTHSIDAQFVTGSVINASRSLTVNDSSVAVIDLSVTGPVVSITDNCLTPGNDTCTHTAPVFQVQQSYASATGPMIQVYSAGAGAAIALGGSGTGTGILIDSNTFGTDISLQNGETISNNTDGLIEFGISSSNELTLGATALRPSSDSGLDLGTSTVQFADLYLDGGNITVDNAMDLDIDDNTASAFTITEGSNNYLNITTSNTTEIITLGSASLDNLYITTNNDDLAGDVQITGGLNVTNDLAVTDDSFLQGDVDITLDDGDTIDVSGDGSATTTMLSINHATSTADAYAQQITLTQNNGTASGADTVGINLSMNGNDADGDVFGIRINGNATANAAAGTYEAGIVIQNFEETAGSMIDAIKVDSSGGNLAITDALDVSDPNIGNALNVGANTITGTDAVIDFTDFDVVAEGFTTIAPDSAGDAITVTAAAADIQALVVDGATADSTQTAGMIDLNIDSSSDTAVGGMYLTFTSIDDDAADTLYGNRTDLVIQDDTTATDTVYGQYIDITNSDTNVAGTGLWIAANDAGAGVVNSGIIIENLQATDIDMTDGLLIRATTDGSMPDAIDVSDAEITNAINAGANFYTMDGIRFFEGLTGRATFEDTSGNDLMSLADISDLGVLTLTGGLTTQAGVSFTDHTSTAATSPVIGIQSNSTALSANRNDYGGYFRLTSDADPGAFAHAMDGLIGVAIYNRNSGNVVGSIFGTEGVASLGSTGLTVATVGGLRGIVASDVAGGTITNAYGVNGKVNAGAGAVVNGYGGNFTNTADGTSRFGIYAEASGGTNNFAGYFTGAAVQIDGDSTPNAPSLTMGAGDLYVAGNIETDTDVRIDGGDIDSSSATFKLFDTSTGTTRIDIGGNTTSVSNTINIATNSTASDTITIGNSNASTTIALTGGDDWSIDTAGVATFDYTTTASGFALCHETNGANTEAVQDCETSPPADYAERYPSAEGITYGDIVVPGEKIIYTDDEFIGKREIRQAVKSSYSYQGPVIGIVSNNYGDFTSAGNNIDDSDNPMPVALVGRVPVNVTNENGSIKVGDYLTTSSTAGFAMKATEVGRVIGMALANFDGASGQVMVQVNNGWYLGDVIGSDGSSTVVTDKAVMAPLGTASSEQPSFDSYGLALRGSAWDGNSAQAVEMLIKASVTDQNNYRLSIRNTSDSEVAYITDKGTMQIAGDMVITGKLYPSDNGIAQTEKYIYYDGSSGPAGDFMRTNAKGWSTGSYDFAEMFPSDNELLPGEVVVLSGDGEKIRKSNSKDYTNIVGVVSTRPGFLAGENIGGSYPIALAGRVPVFSSSENGEIKVGDPLTISSKEGFAMKAKKAGIIVGYALEPLLEGERSVLAYIDVGYWNGNATNQAPGTNNSASQIYVATNIDTSSLNMTGNIYMTGNEIMSIGRLSGISDIWSIEKDGTIKTESVLKTITRSYTDEKVETTAVTSPEVVITLSGTSKLSDGSAEVRFESVSPQFNDVIAADAPIRVVVTPNAPVSLYISEKDNNHFIVKQFSGDQSSIEFDWIVTAYRKGYEPSPVIPSYSDGSLVDSSAPAVPQNDSTAKETSFDPAPPASPDTNIVDQAVSADGGEQAEEPVEAPIETPSSAQEGEQF